MDGNYSASSRSALPRADAVVWFDYPRRVALPRVVWRIAKTYGRVRPTWRRAVPSRSIWEFLRYVWDFSAQAAGPRIVACWPSTGRIRSRACSARDARCSACSLTGLPGEPDAA